MEYYCNPVWVEDYPRGHGGESDRQYERDYRSLADPEVIRVGERWYMYPTYALAWTSDDLTHWRHAPVEPSDAGPAPSVCAYRGKYYLSGGDESLYVADSPLGPFQPLGFFRLPDGRELRLRDTMLFADDDDRLYLYWGLGEQGIFGAELNPADATRLMTEPVCLIRRDAAHAWERFGEYNQSYGKTYLEGAYMLKERGAYYLVYSAPGTCYGSYCLAAYRSQQGPLTGFACQQRNPILAGRQGLIRGPGHGSFTRARDGSLWCFYTIALCYDHKYERRIGMDPAYIDENGELYVDGPSSEPRPAPGCERREIDRLYPLTYHNPVIASSCAPGREGVYAVDESILTWWQPAEDDPAPQLSIRLRAWYWVSGVRALWRDVGLDYARRRLPGPIRYWVEGKGRDGRWRTLMDRSTSHQDVNCDFEVCPPSAVNEVRVRIIGAPEGIAPGLIDLTAFGFFDEDE